MNYIAVGLIIGGIIILLHHYWKHGTLFNVEDINSHEFLAGVCIALGIGGLIL